MAAFDEERIDDFDSLGQIGKGAFGSVLRVRRKGGDEDFALKVIAITRAAAGDADAAAAAAETEKTATNEIGILTAVDEHPFIVRMFHSFVSFSSSVNDDTGDDNADADDGGGGGQRTTAPSECCHCLLLEYLPGGNFRELAARHTLPPPQPPTPAPMPERAAAFFFAELAAAVLFLHECSIVFRDLKVLPLRLWRLWRLWRL